MQSGRSFLTFPSSGSKNKRIKELRRSRQEAELAMDAAGKR
jgi:hypothetical protein